MRSLPVALKMPISGFSLRTVNQDRRGWGERGDYVSIFLSAKFIEIHSYFKAPFGYFYRLNVCDLPAKFVCCCPHPLEMGH